MLSPEELRKCHEVLTACNGDREKASKILCMTRANLTKLISVNKPLGDVWTTKHKPKEAITSVEVFKGPTLKVLEPETYEQAEKRMDAEFQTLVCGTGEMTAEMAAARALQKAYGNHLGRCMDMMGGNLMSRALKLQKLIDDKQRVIEEGVQVMDEVEVMKYTAELNGFIEMHNVLINIMSMTTKTSLARAKIKQMEGTKEAGKPKGKPGFGPKVQATIEVKEKTA